MQVRLILFAAGLGLVACVRPDDETPHAVAHASLMEAQSQAETYAQSDAHAAAGAKAQALSKQQLNERRQQFYRARAAETEGARPRQKSKKTKHLSAEDLERNYNRRIAAKGASSKDPDEVEEEMERNAAASTDSAQQTPDEMLVAQPKVDVTDVPGVNMQQAWEDLERNSLGNGSNSEKQKREETILASEETSYIGAGVGKLALAVTDPRAFLLSLPGMDHFVTGLKVAISLQPADFQGKCLQSGKFKGFGCAARNADPPVCQCTGMLEKCWQDDKTAIVKTFQSGRREEAFERAKSLLFGQCYTPVWLASFAIAGLLSLIISAVLVAYYYYVYKHAAKLDDGPGAFQSIPASLSAFLLRFGVKQPSVS